MVWSVVSGRAMCSALQGRCRAGSRGGDLPPVITEMWPKVAGEAGEDVWGGTECEVLLGSVARQNPVVPPQQDEEQRDANSDARVCRMGQG